MNTRPRAGIVDAPLAAVQATPFGCMGVRIESEAISELIFLPRDHRLVPPASPLAAEACRQVAAYCADPDFRFDLPLANRGTPFQRRVWAAISAIPRGRTLRYGDIARDLDSAARAVGQACGDNFFPLAIPCHRVVSASGLGGFAHHDRISGAAFHLRVKQWLLAHEATGHLPLGQSCP